MAMSETRTLSGVVSCLRELSKIRAAGLGFSALSSIFFAFLLRASKPLLMSLVEILEGEGLSSEILLRDEERLLGFVKRGNYTQTLEVWPKQGRSYLLTRGGQ